MSRQGETEELIAGLIDRALDAANRGDINTAQRLAGEVLAEDATNAEAGELLASERWGVGELRRATLMFCDLVGSTELSTRQEPERYRTVVRQYKAKCRSVIEDGYDGHVVGSKGDGLLALFGVPRAHGNDVERAIRAGLDVVESVHELSDLTQQKIGESLDVRVAVHRGIVYLDNEEDDVYGLAVNVAARLESLAEPGTVVVSEAVRRLADATFVLEAQPPRPVKGVSEPLQPYKVGGIRPGARKAQDRARSPLVGRTEELARIERAWRQVQERSVERPIAVLLRGEAGIGKSRIAGAVVDMVRRDGATVVELSGSPFHVDTGFHPVRMLIEQRAGLVKGAGGADALRRLRAELVGAGMEPDSLVPLLAPILGIPPSAGYEPARSAGRKLAEEISHGAISYVAACLDGGPALLLAEDLQWYDESTRALLDRLIGRLGASLLVVLTGRPDVSPPTRAEVVEVAPLSADESQALLDAIGLEQLDPDHRRALVTRGDGVPLYLEELARATADSPAGGATPSRTDGDGAAVPDLLYELLVARLYATPAAAPVAAAAATIGTEIDHALLAEIVDIPFQELQRAIEVLHTEQVLERQGGQHSRFRHDLLRDVAYELQPPSKRYQLHARIGDILMRRRTENDVADWALIANHFEQAGRRAAAADAFEHAAAQARQRGAFDEAKSNLTKAIESIEGLPASVGRDRREVELRLQRGFFASTVEGNGSASAAVDYGRCLSLAGLDAHDEEMFRTLIVLWGYFAIRGELERARQVLVILRGALDGPRERWRAFNAAGFGMLDWWGGRVAEAHEQLEEAASGARAVEPGDEMLSSWLNPMDPQVAVHIHLALARFTRGLRAGADGALADAEMAAARLEFPQGAFSAAYVHWYAAWMQLESKEFDGADESLQRLMDLSLEHGFDGFVLMGAMQQAAAEGLRVLHSSATPRVLERCAGTLQGLIATWDQFQVKMMLPFYWTVLGAVVAETGDLPGARAHFESSLAIAKTTGGHLYDAETLRRAAALSRDPAEKISGLRDACRTARAQGARLFELRVALDLWEHDPHAYATDLRAAARQFTANARYPEVARALAALARTS